MKILNKLEIHVPDPLDNISSNWSISDWASEPTDYYVSLSDVYEEIQKVRRHERYIYINKIIDILVELNRE